MRGFLRGWRLGERRQRSSGAPDSFCVVDPGATKLRLLAAQVTGDQATVWGWAEAPGCSPEDVRCLLIRGEELLEEVESRARARADDWFLADQILVGLPASQLRGRACTVTQTRTEPEQPVEEEELEALLGRALRLAVKQLRQPGKFLATPGSSPASTAPSSRVGDRRRGRDPAAPQWLLVDAATVALTVDGRKVTDPVGFRASEIGATIFAAAASSQTVETWRRVAQELEFSTLTLTAAPLALAMGVSELQCVILDVGGGKTDLTLWLNGRPVAFESVPIGGTALTQTMMQAWDIPFDTAERLKRAYVGGYLADEDSAQVLEVMFPALRAWLEEIELAMARLDREQPLPQRLYLLGGGSAPPEMVEAARALAWSERLHFVRYPQIGRLRPTDIAGVVNRTGHGGGTGDVSALALAAWASRQSGQTARPMRILNELCDRQQTK